MSDLLLQDVFDEVAQARLLESPLSGLLPGEKVADLAAAAKPGGGG